MLPFFEKFDIQLDKTIEDAREAKQRLLSAFEVGYARKVCSASGLKLQHTYFSDVLDNRRKALVKEEEISQRAQAEEDTKVEARVQEELTKRMRELNLNA